MTGTPSPRSITSVALVTLAVLVAVGAFFGGRATGPDARRVVHRRSGPVVRSAGDEVCVAGPRGRATASIACALWAVPGVAPPAVGATVDGWVAQRQGADGRFVWIQATP